MATPLGNFGYQYCCYYLLLLLLCCFRTAAAIRTAAMTGLQAVLQNRELAANVVSELGSDILPQVRPTYILFFHKDE